jgi:transposase
MEQRAVIHLLTLKGLRASAIAPELSSVYETEGPALSTVKKWRKHFAEGRTSLREDPRCGGLLTNE